jgi:hypothetical protein
MESFQAGVHPLALLSRPEFSGCEDKSFAGGMTWTRTAAAAANADCGRMSYQGLSGHLV